MFDLCRANITVIQPIKVANPLSSYTSGHYSVYVKGQLLEEFDASSA